MTIHLGADHRGFALKETIKKHLIEKHMHVCDHSMQLVEGDDYPVVVTDVVTAMDHAKDVAILVCDTGVGVSIAANKYPGIAAALVCDMFMATKAREHNHANVLCLGSEHEHASPENAIAVVDAFLAAKPDADERHQRRLAQISDIEHSLS